MSRSATRVASDKDRPLDFAERWMHDSLDVLRPAFGVHQLTVDMTAAVRRLDALRREGVNATATHLLIQAAARALAAHPELHVLVSGRRRHHPARVDIGLSVAGEIFVAPVLIIEDAASKSVAQIAAEVAARVPAVRAEDRARLASLRRWGWLVPFAFLRRRLVQLMFSRPEQRRKVAGTFQISTVPVDWAMTSTFVAAGVLVAGRLRSVVAVVDGQPAVRPVITLTLSGDHGVWDGAAAARFMAAVREQLEVAAPLD